MIRKFVEEDTQAVVCAWRKASALAHPFLKEEFIESEAIALRDVYLKHAQTWVAEIDGNVVGFIALVENEVAGLFLDPQFHGRGIGRMLMEYAVSLKGDLNRPGIAGGSLV